MSNELPDLPGAPLEPSEKKFQLGRLREISRPFLSSEISDAAPISCQIKGGELSIHDLPQVFRGHSTVLAYFENYDHLVRSTWSEFVDFFIAREPWQDYDVCVFSEGDGWCVAITHNERVCLVRDGNLPNSSFNADAPKRAG